MASDARAPAAPLNRLGIEIGHHTDRDSQTGMTAFLLKHGGAIGIHIPGGNTGTLNTPAFGVTSAADTVHGVVLTGGSTYGLVSAFGVMRWLEEHGIGNPARGAIVPGIVGAVIYDLGNGKSEVRPTEQDGYQAAASASAAPFAIGRAGVGTGATTGKWYKGHPRRGGFGTATIELPHAMSVSAFVVTNSFGDVGSQPQSTTLPDPLDDLRGLSGVANFERLSTTNFDAPETSPATTLAVVATNTRMDKAQLTRVAQQAAHGLVRAIHPTSLLSDGDVVFALSSNANEGVTPLGVSRNTCTDVVGIGAADAVMRAALNSIGAA